MASEKTMYWAVVVVLALFVGNHFAARFDGSCLAHRSLAAVQRLSSQADHFAAMAEVALGRSSASFARTQTAFARAQAQFASVQTRATHQQVTCARVDAARARMMAVEMRQMRLEVVCPRQRMSVSIPQPLAIPADGTI